MAKSKGDLGNQPGRLEYLVAFLAFFTTAKDFPYVFRTLGFSSILSKEVKTTLLEINRNPEFWYLIVYLGLFFVALFWILPRKNSAGTEREELSNEEEALEFYNRSIRLRYIRSLGFVWVREKILDLIGVDCYGTFSQPADWKDSHDMFKPVDRLLYKNGDSVEYRYLKGFCRIQLRTQKKNEGTYAAQVRRPPTLKESLTLLVASNYFGFWLIVHWVTCFFCYCAAEKDVSGS